MRKIAFIWDWDIIPSQAITWEDGLARAIQILGEKYEVKVYATGAEDYVFKHPYFDINVLNVEHVADSIENFAPDVILHWADCTRPCAKTTARLGIPMALCFAGGDVNGGTAPYFQHIFVESDVYKPGFVKRGIPVTTAFGTNTELFKPIDIKEKTFDTIFPATFALWKRHDLYAKATESFNSLACGYMYDNHEQECWQVCIDHGVTVLPHVSARVLHYLYAASKVCVIPSRSDGGSQRTVLEAMSMNLPLVVTDSDKFDYCEGVCERVEPTIYAVQDAITRILFENKPIDTRSYVLEHWSEYIYADALEKGLLSICQK